MVLSEMTWSCKPRMGWRISRWLRKEGAFVSSVTSRAPPALWASADQSVS